MFKLTAKALAVWAGVIVVTLVMVSMWMFGWGFWQRSTADFRGETAALEEILADPQRRITAYEHFFNLCVDIQRHEATIRALEAELEQGVSESRKEQIRGAITVNRAQRESKINQYNVDAQRDYTIGQFRDADLPSRLDRNAEETQCVSNS